MRMRRSPLLHALTPVTPPVGHRDARHLLAPDRITVAPDHIRVEDRYSRTVALTASARTIPWAWTAGLVRAAGAPLVLALRLTPLSSTHMLRVLTSRLTQYRSSGLLAADHGRLPSANRAQAIADVERLLPLLERGDERLCATSLYARLDAATPAELDERTTRLEAAFGALQMQTRRATFEQEAGLESTLPAGRDSLGVTHETPASTLAAAYPCPTPVLCMPEGIWYGRTLHNNTPLIFDRFYRSGRVGFKNANELMLGTGGGGKSATLKVDATRSLARGVRVVIVDPGESGEYAALAAAVGGQVVRLSAGSHDRINPFDLPQVTDPQYNVLREHVQTSVLRLLDTLLAGAGERLGATERGHLETAVYATYKQVGIDHDGMTHSRTPPTLADLYETLRRGDDPYSLAPRLARYGDGLFAGQTTLRLDADLVVFDLRDLDDEDLRAATMQLVAQHVWSRVVTGERYVRLAVDEAHLMTRRPQTGLFLASLIKRARKYGLSVCLASQDPADLLATEAGRAIFTVSAFAWLFQCEPLALDALKTVLRLSRREEEYVLSCAAGRALLCAQNPYDSTGRLHLMVEVLVDPEEERFVFTEPAPRSGLRVAAQNGG